MISNTTPVAHHLPFILFFFFSDSMAIVEYMVDEEPEYEPQDPHCIGHYHNKYNKFYRYNSNYMDSLFQSFQNVYDESSLGETVTETIILPPYPIQ